MRNVKIFSLITVFAAVLALACTPTVRAEEGAGAKTPAKKTAGTAVQFTFNGLITEQADDEDNPFSMLMAENKRVGVRELLRRLEAAAASEKVACVLLDIEQPVLSWEHAQDLCAAIGKIKKAGKHVIAFGEDLETIHYLLAGTADKIYVSPGGMVLLKGLFARSWYLKGTLDKLGLQADLYQVGDYKGAAEPLTLPGPSKETEEMMKWLLDDWYAQLAEQVGRVRGKDAAVGLAWLEKGPYTATQAAAAGLIDGVKSRQEVLNEVKQQAGLREVDKLETKFAEKKRETIDFSNPFSIFKIFSVLMGAKTAEVSAKPALGLIYAEGLIVSGRGDEDGLVSSLGSASLIAAIEKARADALVKAVVLRIDSPGGSALASEDIHAALARLQKEKPLVVSMGTLAASGGYYIAAPAERIFAHPTSLVGSIGVVGGKIVMKGLYDWMGASSHSYSRGGAMAGIFDEQAPFNPEEQKWVRASMREVYEMFAKAVKDGRGERLKDFEKVSGGRVFTGSQAVANGLADELGGLEQAEAYAAKKAGLKSGAYEVRIINKRPNFAQRFLKGLSGKEGDEDASLSTPRNSLPVSAEMKCLLAALQQANPAQAAILCRQLSLLEMIQQRKTVLMMPFEIDLLP